MTTKDDWEVTPEQQAAIDKLPGRKKPALGSKALTRKTHPPTAHVAATKVDTSRLERIVLRTLLKHGPSTSREISSLSKIDPWSISPRLRPLTNKGYVIEDERRGGQIVWSLTDAGTKLAGRLKRAR